MKVLSVPAENNERPLEGKLAILGIKIVILVATLANETALCCNKP